MTDVFVVNQIREDSDLADHIVTVLTEGGFKVRFDFNSNTQSRDGWKAYRDDNCPIVYVDLATATNNTVLVRFADKDNDVREVHVSKLVYSLEGESK